MLYPYKVWGGLKMNGNATNGTAKESPSELAQLVYVAVLGLCLWVAASGGFL